MWCCYFYFTECIGMDEGYSRVAEEHVKAAKYESNSFVASHNVGPFTFYIRVAPTSFLPLPRPNYC